MLKKIVVLMVLLLSICSTSFSASASINVAFLKFVDKTPYTKLNTGNIVSELLLNELIGFESINIVEHGIIQEALEVENRLNKDQTSMSAAAENNNFAFLLESQNRKAISETVQGDFLPVDDIKFIGDKYGADYILHGTIDYLGSRKEIKTDWVPIVGLEKTNFVLDITSTVRLINIKTGEVVWVHKEKNTSKDRKFDIGSLSAGADKLNATLYDELLAKVSQNMAKALSKDIKSKKLVLRKGAAI